MSEKAQRRQTQAVRDPAAHDAGGAEAQYTLAYQCTEPERKYRLVSQYTEHEHMCNQVYEYAELERMYTFSVH